MYYWFHCFQEHSTKLKMPCGLNLVRSWKVDWFRPVGRFSEILTSPDFPRRRPWCKRWSGAAPGSHRVLGAAILSNKSCTRYFLKLPWQLAFCLYTAPQGFPYKNHWHAPGPTGVSGSGQRANVHTAVDLDLLNKCTHILAILVK